jgi:hypothetical protein
MVSAGPEISMGKWIVLVIAALTILCAAASVLLLVFTR